MDTKEALIARLMAAIVVDEKSGCWIWQGSTKDSGHGRIKVDGKVQAAHRVSFVAHGKRIRRGLVLRHKCDVAACINPAHLVPGTQKQNVRDMVKRGRQNPTSLLNLKQNRKESQHGISK
jgi:hypothetical protein